MENTAQTTVADIINDLDLVDAPTKTPVQEMIDPTPEPTLYDAHAEQRFAFEAEDGDGKYKIAFVFAGLPDDVLAEFDRLREVLVEAEGDKTDINTNSVAADDYLFRELCKDIEGYDGEKPNGWQEMVDYEEKRAANGKILGFKIVDEDSAKTFKKRSWGAKQTGQTITLKARFDDEIVVCKASFGAKTPADVAAYNVIKSRVSLVEKNMDESAIKIPASMARKAKIFDRLNPQTEGYIGEPPLHHKAAFITAFFETSITSAEKK